MPITWPFDLPIPLRYLLQRGALDTYAAHHSEA